MKISELNEDKAAEILTWLSSTDLKFAELRGELEAAEIRQKRARAAAYEGTDGTVAERSAEVELDEHVQAADDAYIAARVAFEKLKAQRESAEMWWDTWRSLEATRRRVMV